MTTTSSNASPWAAGACRSGPFPRRSIEIGAIVVGFIYFWPAAVAYVAWKIAGYPALPQMREFAQTGSWNVSGGTAGSRFAQAFEAAKERTTGATASGNWAFDAYRRAEIEKLEARRRALQEESRAFAEFVEELKRTKDREQFDAFMAKRRAQSGSQGGSQGGSQDGPVIDA